MLASITPLGERGRASRWTLTVTAYLAASTAAGACFGGALGAAGQLLPAGSPSSRLALFAGVATLGLLLDLRLGRLRLPTVSRQVDENWLHRYRGWVYGAGFGWQLGLGVVTIVTSSTVYLTFLLALLSGSALTGALVGGVFGIARAAPILALRGVHSPEALRAAHRRLQAGAPAASRLATVLVAASAGGAGLAGAALAGALT